MNKFKVGDRVRYVGEDKYNMSKGEISTVYQYSPGRLATKNERHTHGGGHIIGDGWTGDNRDVCFELVEEPMTHKQFKEGDKVKCISDYSDKFKMGKVYTVDIRTRGDGSFSVINPDASGIFSGCGMVKDFELVEENMEELDLLLKLANERVKTLETLYDKYSDKIVFKDEKEPRTYTIDGKNIKFTVHSYARKVKKFEDFKLMDSGYLVTQHDDKNIGVGCKTFNKAELVGDLRNLIDNNLNLSGDFSAIRKGVKYTSNIITWKDAEELYNKLKG